MFRRALTALLVGLAAVAAPLAPARAYTPDVLRVGFAPWENYRDITRSSQEVTQLLTTELHIKVQPFVASDYAGVIEAMRAHKIDLAFYPPAAYVLAERNAGAKVILKSLFEGRGAYYSAIITTRDSGVRSLADLRGKRFAFVDPDSTSGAIYPKVMLLNAGIRPERDFRTVLYAGGHDAAVMALLHGKVDACATYTNDEIGRNSSWGKLLGPKSADFGRIVILAHSRPIPSDTIAVRRDLDAGVVSRIKGLFLRLSATPRGRARIHEMYGVDGFGPASSSDYAPVREAFQKVGFRIH